MYIVEIVTSVTTIVKIFDDYNVAKKDYCKYSKRNDIINVTLYDADKNVIDFTCHRLIVLN